MKVKKLSNGKYQVRIYDYVDENGKQHLKQFTSWSKEDVIAQAEEYQNSKGLNQDYANMTFKDACELYISGRENVLSPTTIKKYKFMQRNYQFLDGFKLKQIDSRLVQEYISSISSELSYKSVKDRYALLRSILASYRPSVTLKVVLPRQTKTDRYLPENGDIQKILNVTTDPAMKLAICLGAYGMMRAGEISAFQKDDLKGNVLHIHRNMVLGTDGYVIKSPKTLESDRYMPLPDFVVEMIHQMPCNTIGINPNAITNRWNRLINKTDVPHFRFHDLRHFCCSTYHDLGTSDAIIQSIGGWSSKSGQQTMQTIYRHAIQSSIARQTQNVNEYFDKLNNK